MAGNSQTHRRAPCYLEATRPTIRTSRYHPPSSDPKPKFLICLLFSGHCHYFIGAGELAVNPNPALPEVGIAFDLNDFLCHERARETIQLLLRASWPYMTRVQCSMLAAYFWRGARAAVMHMPARHNFLEVRYSATIVYCRIRGSAMHETIRRSMMDEVRMVPADEAAIEDLERKSIVIMTGSDGDCAVCMEEFRDGCEAVRMPCSHVFHGDCIKKWLRTSHYCPLCRFEMPIAA